MARPGVGKTAITGQIALAIAQHFQAQGSHLTVKLVLCEMTAHQFQERLQCYLARVPVRRVREGRTTDEQQARYEQAARDIAHRVPGPASSGWAARERGHL